MFFLHRTKYDTKILYHNLNKTKEKKMQKILLKNRQNTQKQTIIKTIGKKNGQLNAYRFTKELD